MKVPVPPLADLTLFPITVTTLLRRKFSSALLFWSLCNCELLHIPCKFLQEDQLKDFSSCTNLYFRPIPIPVNAFFPFHDKLTLLFFSCLLNFSLQSDSVTPTFAYSITTLGLFSSCPSPFPPSAAQNSSPLTSHPKCHGNRNPLYLPASAHSSCLFFLCLLWL